MKLTIALITLFAATHCFSQTDTSNDSNTQKQPDTSTHTIVFFDDFTNNKNHWTIANNKDEMASMDSGFYFLTAVGHAYGEAQEVTIDPRKDFQIEARIKIVSGNAEHKNYYSMLFWGREAMNSYYFTFSKDGFASIERCDSKNQSGCTTMKNSLKKTRLPLMILMCIQFKKKETPIPSLLMARCFTKCHSLRFLETYLVLGQAGT